MKTLHINPQTPYELAALVLRTDENLRLLVAALGSLENYMQSYDPSSHLLRLSHKHLLQLLYFLLPETLQALGAHSEAAVLYALGPEVENWEKMYKDWPQTTERLREFFEALGVFPYV